MCPSHIREFLAIHMRAETRVRTWELRCIQDLQVGGEIRPAARQGRKATPSPLRAANGLPARPNQPGAKMAPAGPEAARAEAEGRR